MELRWFNYQIKEGPNTTRWAKRLQYREAPVQVRDDTYTTGTEWQDVPEVNEEETE